MTTFLEFNRNLHHIPLKIRGYLNLAEHLFYEYHGRQQRDSGEPYIEHLYDVMRQIMEIRSDDPGSEIQQAPWELVIAAGLHDILEDTADSPSPVTREIIEQAFSIEDPSFGCKVGFYIQAVSKESRLRYSSKDLRLMAGYQQWLWSATVDYWVLPLKFADRLHNDFTLHGLSFDPGKQIRVAQETLDIYVPVARGVAKKLMPKGFHHWLDACAHKLECVSLAFLGDRYRVQYYPIPVPR